ncbi:hypothetical protein SNEBB_000562 [Seison nebaliae]|nr:hypothetical protein SNEBB_000562 [Seison nebaliae]
MKQLQLLFILLLLISINQSKYVVRFLVVGDETFASFHYHTPDIAHYINSIFSITSALYHLPSLRSMAIDISIEKIIILPSEIKNNSSYNRTNLFSSTYQASLILKEFCAWQGKLDIYKKDKYDVAILLTRNNLCNNETNVCKTLGIANVNGLCNEGRSCMVVEDIGLYTGYIIAHEMGHLFSMDHDTPSNGCPSIKWTLHHPVKYIMETSMTNHLAGEIPNRWSNCSIITLRKFIENKKFCIKYKPNRDYTIIKYEYPLRSLNGIEYSMDDLCQMEYGPETIACHTKDYCGLITCRLFDGRCHTKGNIISIGVSCDVDKWCLDGECVPMENPVFLKTYSSDIINIPFGSLQQQSFPIDGQWSDWSEWSKCSRDCGGGVQKRYRLCNKPQPRLSGKYCEGKNSDYSFCNVRRCYGNDTNWNYLQSQCSKLNRRKISGIIDEWHPILKSAVGNCQLICQSKKYRLLLDSIGFMNDGSTCFYRNPTSNFHSNSNLPKEYLLAKYNNAIGRCVEGECQSIGCDWQSNSNKTLNECNECVEVDSRDSCQKSHYIFNNSLRSSHGMKSNYECLFKMEKGLFSLQVIEQPNSENTYFAISNEKESEYYLNGNYVINWSHLFKLDDVFVYYERNDVIESITIIGELKQTYLFCMLKRDVGAPIENLKITYFKHFPKTISIFPSSFNSTTLPSFDKKNRYNWQNHPEWTQCSSSCGLGSQYRPLTCFDMETNEYVDDKKCDEKKKNGSSIIRNCQLRECPPTWWIGSWSPNCSYSCMELMKEEMIIRLKGFQRRLVVCAEMVSMRRNESFQIIHRSLPDESCSIISHKRPSRTKSCQREINSTIEKILPLCPLSSSKHLPLNNSYKWKNKCPSDISMDPCSYQIQLIPDNFSISTYPIEEHRIIGRRQCFPEISCGIWVTSRWTKCTECPSKIHKNRLNRLYKYRRVYCIGGKYCAEKDRPISKKFCFFMSQRQMDSCRLNKL